MFYFSERDNLTQNFAPDSRMHFSKPAERYLTVVCKDFGQTSKKNCNVCFFSKDKSVSWIFSLHVKHSFAESAEFFPPNFAIFLLDVWKKAVQKIFRKVISTNVSSGHVEPSFDHPVNNFFTALQKHFSSNSVKFH